MANVQNHISSNRYIRIEPLSERVEDASAHAHGAVASVSGTGTRSLIWLPRQTELTHACTD